MLGGFLTALAGLIHVEVGLHRAGADDAGVAQSVERISNVPRAVDLISQISRRSSDVCLTPKIKSTSPKSGKIGFER